LAFDTTKAQPTIVVTHIRPSTSGGQPTITQLGTITLTSKIPAQWWPFVGGLHGNNATPADGSTDGISLYTKNTDWLGSPPDNTYSYAA
jgi:hypothetical protein